MLASQLHIRAGQEDGYNLPKAPPLPRRCENSGGIPAHIEALVAATTDRTGTEALIELDSDPGAEDDDAATASTPETEEAK